MLLEDLQAQVALLGEVIERSVWVFFVFVCMVEGYAIYESEEVCIYFTQADQILEMELARQVSEHRITRNYFRSLVKRWCTGHFCRQFAT